MDQPTDKERKKIYEKAFNILKRAAARKNIDLRPGDIEIELKSVDDIESLGSADEASYTPFAFGNINFSFRVVNKEKITLEDFKEIVKMAGEKRNSIADYTPEFGRIMVKFRAKGLENDFMKFLKWYSAILATATLLWLSTFLKFSNLVIILMILWFPVVIFLWSLAKKN